MTKMSSMGKRTEEKGGVGITSTKNGVNKDRKLATSWFSPRTANSVMCLEIVIGVVMS